LPFASGANVTFDKNALVSGITATSPDQLKSYTMQNVTIMVPGNTRIGLSWQNGTTPGSFQIQATNPIGITNGKFSVSLTGVSFNGSFSVSGSIISSALDNILNKDFSAVIHATDIANALATSNITCESFFGAITGTTK
jgi:hypothetical protein